MPETARGPPRRGRQSGLTEYAQARGVPSFNRARRPSPRRELDRRDEPGRVGGPSA